MPEEILKGLEAGGFDFRAVGWKDNDRLRSLAIGLSKNPKFHKLPSGPYGLTSWYDEAILKKPSERRKKKLGTAAKRKLQRMRRRTMNELASISTTTTRAQQKRL